VIEKRKSKYSSQAGIEELVNTILDNSDLSAKYQNALADRTNDLRKILLDHYTSIERERIRENEADLKNKSNITELNDKIFKLERRIEEIKPSGFWTILGMIFSTMIIILAGSFLY